MQSIIEQLAAPFEPEAVRWRAGSLTQDKSKAKALAYINARDVMWRLDGVCSDGWCDEIVVLPNGMVTCRIGIWFGERLVYRQDGTGQMEERPDGKIDIKNEQRIEMQQKGATSDAFKRAAVKWGVGRYLHGLPSMWARVNQWGQIDESELPRLRDMLRRAAPAKPSSASASQVMSAPPSEGAQDESVATIQAGVLATKTVDDANEYLKRKLASIEQLFPADRDRLRTIAKAHLEHLRGHANGAAA